LPCASATGVLTPARGRRRPPRPREGASKDGLKQIKGIRDTLADKIVSYRSEHGGFKSLDELDQVPGFSEIRKEEIRNAVTLAGKSSK
jgi:competence protein ComEA